jgi:hypothetical protein
MSRDRAISIILACIVAGLLFDGNTLEGFGIGLLLGLVLGATVGAAFVWGEREARP